MPADLLLAHGSTETTTAACLLDHIPGIIAFIRNKRYAEDVAKDAAQEAIFAALVKIKKGEFSEIREPGAWIRKVAARVAIKLAQRRCAIDSQAIEKQVAEPPEMTVLRDTSIDVLAAVRQLPPDLRDLVEFCYLLGNTFQKTAEHFCLPAGTVGSRLEKARGLLRALLGEAYQQRKENCANGA